MVVTLTKLTDEKSLGIGIMSRYLGSFVKDENE